MWESASLASSQMMLMLQVQGPAQFLTAPAITKIGKSTFKTLHDTALYKIQNNVIHTHVPTISLK